MHVRRHCQGWPGLADPLALEDRALRKSHQCLATARGSATARLDAGRFFHLLEGARLDLAHPLTRDAEFLVKLFKGHRLFGETARHEDAPLAVATQITDFCIMVPLQVSAAVGKDRIRAPT